MTRVAGIDGYRRGWVAVVVADGCFAGADAAARLDTLIAGLGELDGMGVDIPIGLPDAGFREAERPRPRCPGGRGSREARFG
ncbi:MAG: DUF429 domain-containing protein [Actinomycetota bacterium]|nr:DUF429 domain-containing protein [Actinomycetota bacterium]